MVAIHQQQTSVGDRRQNESFTKTICFPFNASRAFMPYASSFVWAKSKKYNKYLKGRKKIE